MVAWRMLVLSALTPWHARSRGGVHMPLPMCPDARVVLTCSDGWVVCAQVYILMHGQISIMKGSLLLTTLMAEQA